jgi:hypothetical protein
MKLNKIQIQAISKKIETELFDCIKKNNDTIINSNEYVNFYKKDKICIQIIKLFPNCIKENLAYGYEDYHASMLIKCRRDAFFKNKFKSRHYGIREIENELIMSSIEVSNLQELIDNIKSKFTV